MAGLTTTGFVAKTQQEIADEMVVSLRGALGDDLDTSAESVLGQVVGIVSLQVRELWEVLQSTYDARDRGNASFQTLDALCALTGTTRRAATKGLVRLRLTIQPGFTVPAGSIAAVATDATNRWITLQAATNATMVSGTFEVDAEAETAGVFRANAATITTIATPVAGWTQVTNLLDASPGKPIESDADLRARTERELSLSGTSSVDAIRADLSTLKDVVLVIVEENATPFVDALGRPPHCVEAIVQFTSGLGATPLSEARQRVVDQLWKSKAGGIDTYGTQTPRTTTDALGQTHLVRWSEPTAVDISVALDLAIDASIYVGDDRVKSLVLEYGALLVMGRDVIRTRVVAAALKAAGVVDVTYCAISAPSTLPRESNYPIRARELAVFDTSRITITTHAAVDV